MNSIQAHRIVNDWLNHDVVTSCELTFMELGMLVKRIVEVEPFEQAKPYTPEQAAEMRHESIELQKHVHNAKRAVYCKLPGCDGIVKAKGMCFTHYKRMLKGLPLDTPIKRRAKTTAAPAPVVPKAKRGRRTARRPFNPTETTRLEANGQMETVHRDDCPNLKKCTAWAKKRRWDGFTCTRCADLGGAPS